MKYKISRLEKEEFPNKLKCIKNPPKHIYLIGNKDLLFEDSFGIVGTRRITDYGIKNCEYFTRELVFRNIPVVSGMAIGTDSVAHRTSLEYGGKTIAVLGSGFDNIFPKQNVELFEKIIEMGGLVITEFEDNMKPMKENFPKRNRIVTALSEGILVIEAAYRSGTSITVNNAKEQGKLVFAIPGKLDSSVGTGVNIMIKKGAILTTEIEDIISRYPQFENRLRISREKILSKSVKIKEEYKKIYEILNKQLEEGLYLEEILSESGITIKEILRLLTCMEMDGILTQEVTGKYKLN